VDNGVKITYKHGDICTNSENPADNNMPRKINFVATCGTPSADGTNNLLNNDRNLGQEQNQFRHSYKM
jgi:hypothetical protein